MHSIIGRSVSRPIAGLAFLALTASTAAAQMVAPPPYLSAVLNPRAERACSNSLFTLEVPLWRPAMPSTFVADFTAKLAINPAWFGCPGCVGKYRPRLTPVLADYHDPLVHPAVPPSRRDGHQRAFVVRFERLEPSTLEWVTVNVVPSQSCAVVSALRAAGAATLGLSISSGYSVQPPFLVSRSCDVLVQDSEAWNASSTTNWAKTRISALPLPGLPPVDVALVDTGVPASYRAGLGVIAERPLPSFEPTAPEYHPHGAHMAALINSIAPHAQVRSYRALGQGGAGSVASVARATDDAIFDNGWTVGGRRPLVVNLSVGAPSDFYSPAALTGPSCSTWEDGTGEIFRYVLSVAGELNPQGPQVFVFAAGGNAPLERLPTSFTPWVRRPVRTPCAGIDVAPGSVAPFLPAGFGEWASCRRTASGTLKEAWLPVLQVGASTYDDRRSVMTQQQGQPWLFAPGERVFASSSALPPVAPHVTCGPDVGLSKGFESPATVTGTSAATAYVSAAAAHLIARAPWGPSGKGWSAAELARLLFLTGEPLCEAKVGNLWADAIGRNRISISRADQALTSGSSGCASLRACLRSSAHPVGPMVGAATTSVCGAAMSACFGSLAFPKCGETGDEPGWTAGQYAQISTSAPACRAAWYVPSGPPTRRLTGSNAAFPEVQQAGIGPQPSGSGCPNCSVLVAPGAGLWLEFELSDAFPERTRILDAHFVLLTTEKYPIVYLPVSDGREWRPGEVGLIKLALTPEQERVAAEYLRAQWWLPVFDLAVELDGREARFVSPLRVRFVGDKPE